jgi:prepilin-type N-terminal cleavage/methylation domain-containing protein
MPRSASGFTLLEILVALAIAAGALVLVTAAVSGSLKRSAQAEVDGRLERAAESKLAEWTSGLDAQREGALAGFDGHRWEIRMSAEPGPLKRLQRVTLSIYGPGGARLLERSELLHGTPGPR